MTLIDLKKSLHADKRVFETALQCDEKTANKYLLGIYNTIINNNRLQQCELESIKNAAVTSATLGLPVDARGLAYLIPYKGKAQFQMSYKGYVYLAKQDTDVDNVVTGLVYPDDDFSVDLGNNVVNHIPKLDSPSYGKEESIRFVYAIVRFKHDTGRSQIFEVMTKKQVDEIRESSQAGGEKDKWGNPTIWQKHYGEMARKTVIKRILKHAQLGNSLCDLVDNSIHENKVINVTPEGELLVDEPDEKLKQEVIEATNKCTTLEELEDVQAKYQDKHQELALYNVAVSKAITSEYSKKHDELYIEKLENALDSCEDPDSLDLVYANHEKRINSLKAADRKHMQEYYASRKDLFLN